jgi:hypothetical protein
VSLREYWERRKTLLFIVVVSVLCAPVMAVGSGLNVAVIGAILTDTGALFGSLVELVVACVPLLLVLACVGMIIGLFVVLGQRINR